jgi:hypothetical protein
MAGAGSEDEDGGGLLTPRFDWGWLRRQIGKRAYQLP